MKQVAAAILERDGTVLVARRAEGQAMAGAWEFPGGKLEPGETPADCMVRELREELGIAVAAGEELTRVVHRYPGGAIELIAIRATWLSGEIGLTVHDAVRWVAPADLAALDLLPADVPVARRLAEG
ncbi:NUDIX hydrolase [Sphingomonas metalli]|uniref:8-oxo-dGTP diphosphatase n=1 Tax=Sphingomonas metalli TaxID=1779358 RepID=A0A916SXC5_9SPHN|nr:8-oxo-dGTP diphosphatase MutT [Sphingomonas metalli]GGB22366.1 NUDIX hydrolase [Sphingomonas metalli]